LPPKIGRLRLPAQIIRFSFLIVAFILAACCAISPAQSPEENPYYGSKNSLGILGAYSWDSSHMVLGYAENRMLVNIGVSYSRILFRNHIVNWQYDGELLPVALESDPVQYTTMYFTSTVIPSVSFTTTSAAPTLTACSPGSGTGNIPGFATYTYTSTCGRQWTIGEAISPVGFRWNFLPRRKLQPFLDGHGGYMYSTQDIPIPQAGSFNFTFDFGAGIELYRSNTRSIRAEYRIHHISNHNTAMYNPGIDSGLLQVTYSFGFRRW
jgi:hypothetical protein